MKSVVTVTDAAREMIFELITGEGEDNVSLGLRIEVIGVNGPEYSYDLSFESVDAAVDGDLVEDVGGLTVIIPDGSVEKLQGATLDLPSAGGAGMVLRNPNRPDVLGDADIELTGTVDERINTLLEKVINPQLGMHGGFAELRAFEDGNAYVFMGGGCQGCAVSAITLKSGIEATMKAKIPEIEDVVDVTDHDAGTNPYYEAAKK